MLRREKACHKILIIPDPNQIETERVEESIYIIREDKEDILRMISVCLEEQIYQILEILENWLENLPMEGFGKPEIVDEIKDIRKEMLFHDNQHSTIASAVVPINVKEFLLK